MSPVVETQRLGEGVGYDTYTAVLRAGSAMTRQLGLALLPEGITPQLFRLLMLLHKAGGSLRIGRLATQMEKSTHTLTGLADRAEARDWVERRFDRRDRRATTIALTEAGKIKLRMAWSIASPLLERACQQTEGRGDLMWLKQTCEALRAATSRP